LQPSAIFTTKYFFNWAPLLFHAAEGGQKPPSTRHSLRRENLFLVLHIHVLGVDHAFIFLLLLAAGFVLRRTGLRTRASITCRRSLRGFIHDLGQLVRSLRQLLARRIHGCSVRTFQGLLGIGNRRLNLALLVARDLVAVLFQGLFHLID